jgi:hypothetical protein
VTGPITGLRSMRKLIRAIAVLVRDMMDILTFRKPSRRG